MSACVYVLKEAMQQWYHHYQAAQAHTYSAAAPQDGTASEYSKEHAQVPASCSISPLSLQILQAGRHRAVVICAFCCV